MKKNLFGLMLLALPLAFTSCGDSDDPTPSPSPSSVVLSAPTYKDAATKVVITEESPVLALELTEGGRFLMKVSDSPALAPRRAARRDASTFSYIYGSYTVSGSKYLLSNGAEVTITGNGNATKLSISGLTGDQAVYNVSNVTGTTASKKSASTATNNICRSWKVAATTLQVEGIAALNVAHRFTGCDLDKIVAYARQYCEFETEGVEEGLKVSSVEFTSAGTYSLVFEKGQPFIGTWNWRNESTGLISYAYETQNYSFWTGEAVATVSNNSTSLQLGLKVTSEGKEYTGKLTLTLQELK